MNSTSQPELKCLHLEVNWSVESYMKPIHITTAVINSIFAVASTLGNSLILFVIWKHPSLQTASNTLLCCLAFSDFLVGLLAQTAFVAHKIGELNADFSLYCATRVTTEMVGVITSGVSTLTLAAISVERYLAIRLNLRYKEIVTNARIFYVVGSFWFLLITTTVAKISIPNVEALFNAFLFLILLGSFVIVLVSYTLVFRCVVKHQSRINANSIHADAQPATVSGNTTNGARKTSRVFSLMRYKKSISAMAYILGCYLLFYLPFITALVARKFLGYTSTVKAAYVCTSTWAYLNSSVNPIIYCWRISDIRGPVKQTLNKLLRRPDMTPGEYQLSSRVGASSFDRKVNIAPVYPK